MATNDFLPFAGGAGSNVLTQTAYNALAARTSGFSSGVAKSAELNKVWRQSSIIAAVIGQFINDMSGQDALDDGTITTLLANLKASIGAVGRIGASSYALDTGSANSYAVAYTPAITSLVDGMVLRFKAASANTGASTFNPNGLGAKAIVGGAHAALQGGEIVTNGDVWLQYNTSIGGGSWILVDSTGGALQVPPAAQSAQAINLGQFTGSNQSLNALGFQKLPGGLIEQWGTITLGAVGNFNAVTVAGITYYTQAYIVNLPTAYLADHYEVVVSLAGSYFASQSNEYGSWVRSNRNVNSGSSVSLTQFTVTVTTATLGYVPVIHFESRGK